MEYKDRDELGKEEPAKSIVNSIKNIEDSGKIFFYGINEEQRVIEGLRKGYWEDDRVRSIQSTVNKRLEEDNVPFEFEMKPISLKNGEKCILIGIAHSITYLLK